MLGLTFPLRVSLLKCVPNKITVLVQQYTPRPLLCPVMISHPFWYLLVYFWIRWPPMLFSLYNWAQRSGVRTAGGGIKINGPWNKRGPVPVADKWSSSIILINILLKKSFTLWGGGPRMQLSWNRSTLMRSECFSLSLYDSCFHDTFEWKVFFFFFFFHPLLAGCDIGSVLNLSEFELRYWRNFAILQTWALYFWLRRF